MFDYSNASAVTSNNIEHCRYISDKKPILLYSNSRVTSSAPSPLTNHVLDKGTHDVDDAV